ncbi:MAG: hypothetical protein H6626_09005 [Pseudobdellovibrionaceae bacterium]|nr:MAG: hypothetical protein H6626_09005 [Pseudobdellovibrionaceae bacterium]
MKMKQKIYYLAAVFVMTTHLFAASVEAQQGDGKEKPIGFELGAHAGVFLPDQVEYVTEIMSMWGMRMSWATKRGPFVELGGMVGHDEGVDWQNLSLSYRINYPLEEMLGLFYIGADAHRYLGTSQTDWKIFGGGHMGGGIMAQIGEPLWFRADMKFNVNPGVSMYFGFGFVFRYPEEEKQQENNLPQ